MGTWSMMWLGVFLSGRHPDTGQLFVQTVLDGLGTGGGARTNSDGLNATCIAASNVLIPNVEIEEEFFPVRFLRREIKADTGGPGQFRGGCALETEIEMLADCEFDHPGQPVQERAAAGHPRRQDTAVERIFRRIAPDGTVTEFPPEDHGGSLQERRSTGHASVWRRRSRRSHRDATVLASNKDIALGYLTPEAAARDYGYNHGGRIAAGWRKGSVRAIVRDFQRPGRSPVIATRGMAATSHPLSTLTAINVLQNGGNAVDAAVAACAVQCVVEPGSTGIGGDCFALYAPAGGGVIAFNGSGRAPAAATADWYARHGIAASSGSRPMPSRVPGAVDAWSAAAPRSRHARTRRIAPAGDPAWPPKVTRSRQESASIGDAKSRCCVAMPDARRIFLTDGSAPPVGSIHRQPEMAATLQSDRGTWSRCILPRPRRRRHRRMPAGAWRLAHDGRFRRRARRLCHADQDRFSRLRRL